LGSLRGMGDDEMKQGPILWPGAPRSPQRTWDENDGAEPLRTFSLDAQDMAPERAIRGTQNFVEFGWAFHIKDTNNSRICRRFATDGAICAAAAVLLPGHFPGHSAARPSRRSTS